MLLSYLLRSFMRAGTLEIIDAGGKTHSFGDGSEPRARIRLHRRSLHWKIALDPELAAGEAYMDGTLTVEEGDYFTFIDLVSRNMMSARQAPPIRFKTAVERLLRPLMQFNHHRRAKRNVAHHYDLSSTLYELFLDKDRQYSCAYFTSPDDTLEEAQEAKKRHIAAKLLLQPQHRVLDIGCGWGGLGLFINRMSDASVIGVTLSEEQLKIASDRAKASPSGDRVSFRLQDYRNVSETFDRIVSVGMFEHVGIPHYREYFEKIRDLLDENGVALIHTIGRFDGPGVTDSFTRKYIFPGGYCPALSEIMPVIERTGLIVTDIEVLRLHYAETLRHWRLRFGENRPKVAELYDERFCRMWEFWLAGSECVFRYGGHVVFQIQLAKRRDAVPLTRDYITETERQPSRRAAAE